MGNPRSGAEKEIIIYRCRGNGRRWGVPAHGGKFLREFPHKGGSMEYSDCVDRFNRILVRAHRIIQTNF